jgi:hypothetical protein
VPRLDALLFDRFDHRHSPEFDPEVPLERIEHARWGHVVEEQAQLRVEFLPVAHPRDVTVLVRFVQGTGRFDRWIDGS